MSHPYREQAKSTHKAKTSYMGKANNLDIPIMRAVGENSSKKLYSSSSNSMQHKDQSAADGMKRGGHVGKMKHKSKPKMPMVVPEVTAAPPSPDPSLAAAGAGMSSPAPAPPMPPMKRGGRTGGVDSGVGRLESAHSGKLKPIR